MMTLLAEARCETHFPFFLSLNSISRIYHLSCSLNLVPKGFYCFQNSGFLHKQQWLITTKAVLKACYKISERKHPKGRLEWHPEKGAWHLCGPAGAMEGHGSCLPLEMCVCVFMWVGVSLSCHSSGSKVPSLKLCFILDRISHWLGALHKLACHRASPREIPLCLHLPSSGFIRGLYTLHFMWIQRINSGLYACRASSMLTEWSSNSSVCISIHVFLCLYICTCMYCVYVYMYKCVMCMSTYVMCISMCAH